ncbi:MAG: RAD52 family DNA repair protein [Sulfurovum sp.]|nr:RAD52 family DNA repair protein [Sulfurovum sp.]MCB4746427.1 RAD52 family DNA repair protein [Sulfurovum sp.]MCB4748779.1 RAD52 family DNA repair protein [Sulfurovum sp.]
MGHTEDVSREDVGFGTGIAKTLADAHEGGAKEAATDALKRSLRSFGNQFGNSLYDKSRNHQYSRMELRVNSKHFNLKHLYKLAKILDVPVSETS